MRAPGDSLGWCGAKVFAPGLAGPRALEMVWREGVATDVFAPGSRSGSRGERLASRPYDADPPSMTPFSARPAAPRRWR
jgi:hypothetical protein